MGETGLTEGVWVGCSVLGCGVGESDGEDEGCWLGVVEGELDGLEEGTVDGC